MENLLYQQAYQCHSIVRSSYNVLCSYLTTYFLDICTSRKSSRDPPRHVTSQVKYIAIGYAILYQKKVEHVIRIVIQKMILRYKGYIFSIFHFKQKSIDAVQIF